MSAGSFKRERVHAGTDYHNILFSIPSPVGYRIRVRLDVELGLPQHGASLRIERAKPRVVCAANKDQPSSRCDAAALSEGARIMHALLFKFVTRAEWNFPGDVSRVRVDGHEVRPRRLLAWKLIRRIPKSRIIRPAAGKRR